MNVMEALTELYAKVVGSAPAATDNIGELIHELAENWLEQAEG